MGKRLILLAPLTVGPIGKLAAREQAELQPRYLVLLVLRCVKNGDRGPRRAKFFSTFLSLERTTASEKPCLTPCFAKQIHFYRWRIIRNSVLSDKRRS